jgi:hypothetical protein
MGKVILGAFVGIGFGMLLAAIGAATLRQSPQLGAFLIAIGGSQWAVVGALAGGISAVLAMVRRHLAVTAADRLPGWGRAAVPTLLDLFQGGDPGVRVRAAQLLGEIGPEAKAAVPTLRGCVWEAQHYHMHNAEVAVAAAEALRRIDLPDKSATGQG